MNTKPKEREMTAARTYVLGLLGLAVATLLIVAWIVQGAHILPWIQL